LPVALAGECRGWQPQCCVAAPTQESRKSRPPAF